MTKLKQMLLSFIILIGSMQVNANTNVNVAGAVNMAAEAFSSMVHGPNYVELDEGRIHAGFKENLFFLGNINFGNSIVFPRYETKLITNYITTTVPELVGYETVVTGYERYISHYDYIPPGEPILVGYGPDTVVPVNLGAVKINGERTTMGWAQTWRADWLKANAPVAGWKNNDYMAQAELDLNACVGGSNICHVEIGNPSGVKIIEGNAGSCSSPSTCTADFVITGSYSEPKSHPNGTPGEHGEWKPEFTAIDETIVPGEPIYDESEGETVPVYKEREITEERPVYEDKEETTEEKIERLERAKSEWRLSFAPAFFVQSDFGTLVLNQAGNNEDLNKSVLGKQNFYQAQVGDSSPCVQERRQQQRLEFVTQQNQTQEQFKFPDFFITSDNCGPYLVKKHYTITVGAGVTMSARYVNAGVVSAITPSVALLPMIGGGAYSIRTVETKEEAERSSYLNIPRDISDFNDWRNNDSLQYKVHGGIVFTGGVSFYGLAAGVSYFAQGEWKRTFVKVNENSVFARLDRDKLMSFGIYGSAAIASMSLQKFKTWEDGISFTFDITSSKGRKALENFMSGNIKDVQKAATSTLDNGVVIGYKTKGKTSGRGVSAGFGLPYIPVLAQWNKTSFENNTETTHFGSTRFEEETVNADLNTFKGQFFPLFKNVVEGFFTKVKKFNGATTLFINKVQSGQYAYNFQRSYADVEDIEKALEHIKYKTGLFSFLDFKFPSNLKKVGSVDLKFGTRFKTAATKYLIENKNSGALEKISRQYLYSYFNSLNADQNGVYNICLGSTRGMIKICQKRMIRKTEEAVSDMVKYLGQMSRYSGEGEDQREKFAEAYSNFGKAMLKTPFAFQAALNLAKGKGVDVYFSLETSETKKHEAILQFNAL